MASLPLLLSFADELDDLNELCGYSRSPFNSSYYPQCYHHQNRPNPLRILLSTPSVQRAVAEKKGKENVSPIGKDGFQVCMDVQQFKPNELSVKTVDNCIVVEGKHEERQDEHGFIARHFSRRYVLPDGYDSKQAISTLSSDGVLTVKVPLPQKKESNERIVQIQQTGPAHLSVKENTKEEEKKEEKEKK